MSIVNVTLGNYLSSEIIIWPYGIRRVVFHNGIQERHTTMRYCPALDGVANARSPAAVVLAVVRAPPAGVTVNGGLNT